MDKEQELMINYDSPKMEIIEVEVEKGFAVSLDKDNLTPMPGIW